LGEARRREIKKVGLIEAQAKRKRYLIRFAVTSEMGTNFSIPKEELGELTQWTAFKKEDLKRWYRKFMENYPDGKLKMEHFRKVYKELYQSSSTTRSTENDFANHIFRSFDRHNKGFVSFKELMLAFSLTSCGTKREKLEWSFNVFDVTQSGKISMEDVHQIFDSVNDCKGSGEVAMSRLDVAELFIKIDNDGDGYWSIDEFIEGTKKYPNFFRRTLKVNRIRQNSVTERT